ncbi:MAG: homogentisate 1,2-dioxygenase [Bdellovibrionales bacterium]|nr:homogentisate 1,2-dioxygenase [Bdellovibrionales bacterium]
MSFRKPFQFPLMQGIHNKQAHVDVPEGTFEEELGREGFFGPAAHLFHQRQPTGWVEIEGDCRPHAYDFNLLKGPSAPNTLQLQRLFFNKSVSVSMATSVGSDPLYSRNADGDELHFVHEGEGVMESEFGRLNYQTGDYIYVPRCATYRFLGRGVGRRLVIESSNGTFTQPDRGILGHHALYDPGVLEIPAVGPSTEGPTDAKRGLWQIRIKRADRYTTMSYDYNPLDVVGFKGDLCVFKLPIKAIRAVMSHRAHLAPSVHSTFVADRFVICTFTPRPLEEEEGAQRVPFFHRNVEYDEVIFYHAGDFFSRDNIRPGWITFHPTGIHHGPHPKALANQFKKTRTDEYAVMIDTRDPLEIDNSAPVVACEFKDYWKSWMPKP